MEVSRIERRELGRPSTTRRRTPRRPSRARGPTRDAGSRGRASGSVSSGSSASTALAPACGTSSMRARRARRVPGSQPIWCATRAARCSRGSAASGNAPPSRVGRQRDAARVPGAAGLVLVDAEVRADVVEVERRPEPEELRRRARARRPRARRPGGRPTSGRARRARRAGAISSAPALDLERPRPAPELREPRRVHHDLRAGAQRRARLLDRRRARAEHQVAGDPARVRRRRARAACAAARPPRSRSVRRASRCARAARAARRGPRAGGRPRAR